MAFLLGVAFWYWVLAHTEIGADISCLILDCAGDFLGEISRECYAVSHKINQRIKLRTLERPADWRRQPPRKRSSRNALRVQLPPFPPR